MQQSPCSQHASNVLVPIWNGCETILVFMLALHPLWDAFQLDIFPLSFAMLNCQYS